MDDSPSSGSSLKSAAPSAAPAVTRAAAILGVLAESINGRMTLSEVAREVGIPKSSASNILMALEDAKLVHRHQSFFALGRKLVELGAAYLGRMDEVQEFYRFCEQSSVLADETVRIAMLDGTNVIYLARYEGHPAVRLTSSIGDKMPVSLCAVGKVLTARLHELTISEQFPDSTRLPMLTHKSLPTGAALKDELQKIREQGYAFEDEESTLGVVCLAVAVPTRGAHGPSLGLSVTALKATYTDEQGARIVKELKTLAHSLGNPMG